MSGTATWIILAEDLSGARFAEQYLRSRGVDGWAIRTRTPSPGSGSGKQWVTQTFAEEVQELRAKAPHVWKALLVCTDADELSIRARLAALDESLRGAGLSPRTEHERIAMLVPRWEIETWAEHILRGGAVSEDAKMGWDSDRSRRECRLAGARLRAHRNPPSACPACCPPSLVASDTEVARLG